MGYPKNYVVYADGMGFLTDSSRPDYFFVSVVDEALRFKKKDAEGVAKTIRDEYTSAFVMKVCSGFKASKNLK